ncbi:MAG: DUF4859 domain-containing protein [Chitinophagaceae bacterium]
MQYPVYKQLKRSTVTVCCVIALFFFSCKKDAYLTDGGLASSNTTYTTYDYLANHQYHYFDTLIMVIDHLGLKDSVNSAGTFFAPTDYAIHRVMAANNLTTLDELYAKINSKFLTQYMFSDTTLTLDNATTSVKTYENWAATTVGLSKIAYSYTVANSVLTYYILQYVKINGALDGSADATDDDETDAILQCQTTGIKTASGTNLNVLSNVANLDLFEDEVATEKTYTFSLDVIQNDDYTSTALQLDSSSIASFFGLSATAISDMIVAGSDSLGYYNVQSDGTLSNTYTANAPGFWLDANGDVVSWGSDAYLYAELSPSTYIINVGAYPGNPQVGDTYTIRLAFVYTSIDGNTYTANIVINVTIVSP